jgi:hypothetical protein
VVVLDGTIADEKALTVIAKAVDTVALASSALVRVGVIQPGSPRALAVADLLDRARNLVNAAASARTAQSYGEAMAAIAPIMMEIAAKIRN